jgi:hypothetical protein
MNAHQFEKSIGASNGYVHHLKNSISFDKLEKILEIFQELNIEWLLFGKGEMLKSSAQDSAVINEPTVAYISSDEFQRLQQKIMALQEELIDSKNLIIHFQKLLSEKKYELDKNTTKQPMKETA